MEKQDQIELRREHVFKSVSKGESQISIAKRLQLNESVISRDLKYLRDQAIINIQNYLDEKLPIEYEKCLAGINAILEEAWNISERSSNLSNVKEKIQALSLAKECYQMKMDMLTNVKVIQDSMRFIERHKDKEKNNKNRGLISANVSNDNTTTEVEETLNKVF